MQVKGRNLRQSNDKSAVNVNHLRHMTRVRRPTGLVCINEALWIIHYVRYQYGHETGVVIMLD